MMILSRRESILPDAILCIVVVLSCCYMSEGQVPNGDFETGNYSGWSWVSGTAWGPAPVDQRWHPSITAWEGRYYANSYAQGETAVGVIRSSTFTLNMPVTFLIAGWNHVPGQQPEYHHNYVALKRASDGVELDRVYAPNSSTLRMYNLAAPDAIGEAVYIELVDDGSDAGYAWMAVDLFVEGTKRPEGDFETGTFENWQIASGTAWGSGPVSSSSIASGWQRTYFGDTLHSGESAVGVLRSDAFKLAGPIQFRIAGASYWPGVDPPQDHNYVALKRAPDGLELDRVWTPNAAAFTGAVLKSPDHIGEQVYLEVVDDGAGSAWAWIAVDAFDISGSSLNWDTRSDTWVATDALGRSLPTLAEAGPARDDRFVGIFYFTWHGEHGWDGPFDVNQVEQAHPYSPALYPTIDDYLDELENHLGTFGQGHHWGEPVFDYYVASDDYVLRKHIQMLADAGIDTLIIDNTNGFSYQNNIHLLMSLCQRIRNEGGNTPQIAILVRENIVDNEELQAAYNTIYKPGLFPDLWFRWRGKPLLLVFDAENPPSLDLSQEIQDFFTIRECWAFSSWAWFGDGQHKWPWIDSYPQGYGWDTDPQTPEAMAVAIGQHANGNIGRSYSNGTQPPFGQAPTELGLHLIEQADRALAVDPEFVFFTGWNEWVAGRWEIGSDAFPASSYAFLGTTRTVGQSLFVDAFDHEYSRDAEPVRGGHGDSYYYQMIDFVRRFKGVHSEETPSVPHTVAIDGAFADWAGVSPEFRDTLDDLPRRNDHPGYFSAGPYTNLSGRNDIVESRATYDHENVYVYARSRLPLTTYAGTDWMVLYIDADADASTGWEGYDFAIGRTGATSTTRPVEVASGNSWAWTTVGSVAYAASGSELELAIPRSMIGETAYPVAFDFKWVDHAEPAGDISRFTTHGDAAPNDRFNYRYAGPDVVYAPDADSDGDVDVADFAILQRCQGEALPLSPECIGADVDGDGDLDGDDLGALLFCLTGPGGLSAPQCGG